MRKFFLFLSKAEKSIFRILVMFVSFLAVLLLILITCQIIARYFNLRFLTPPDEIIKLIFAWMLFLGASLLVRDFSHLRIDMLENILNRLWMRKVYYVFINLLVLLFLFFMFQSSWKTFVMAAGRQSPMLQLPQRYWYISLPASNILMIFYTIINISKAIFIKEEKR